MPGSNFNVGAPLEIIQQASTPAAPDSGDTLLYPKTDGEIYKQTSAGVEERLLSYSDIQVIDSNTAPTSPTQPYFRIHRDSGGNIDSIYFGWP